jgi:hypothetical protein
MPEPVVTTSERLWSEEVGLANADEIQKPVPVYEWSNGRKMTDGHGPYSNNAVVPE